MTAASSGVRRVERRHVNFLMQGGAAAARETHNLEVVGASPAPATNIMVSPLLKAALIRGGRCVCAGRRTPVVISAFARLLPGSARLRFCESFRVSARLHARNFAHGDSQCPRLRLLAFFKIGRHAISQLQGRGICGPSR